MDKKDDIAVGIKSTAVLFGLHAWPILCLFAFGFVSSLMAVGHALNASLMYYVLAVGGTGAHLVWQLATIDLESQQSCLRMFQVNCSQVGYYVWFGLAAAYLENSG